MLMGTRFTVSTDDEHSVIHYGFATQYGLFQSAIGLTYFRAEHIATWLSEGLIDRDSGYFLSGPVEGGNDEVVVNGKHAVRDGVEDHSHFGGCEIFFRFHSERVRLLILQIAMIIGSLVHFATGVLAKICQKINNIM